MKYSPVILVLLLCGIFAMSFAQETETEIPSSLRNNQYYTESLKQANLARLAYMEGDYDASIRYSEEAIRYANLSDEYVLYRLRMFETDKAILAAANRITYAISINAAFRFPDEFSAAQAAYAEARSFRAAERWDDAIDAANRVLAILAVLDREIDGRTGPFPAQYTVRVWESYKDCLWNIAAQSWVYNDPHKWELLYNANKSKMPRSGNPDLIYPGMILDIPSIKGEVRQGMWNPNTMYPSLQ